MFDQEVLVRLWKASFYIQQTCLILNDMKDFKNLMMQAMNFVIHLVIVVLVYVRVCACGCNLDAV